MNPTVVLNSKTEVVSKNRAGGDAGEGSRPTVLIASVAPEICHELKKLLEAFSVNAIWSKGVEATKRVLAKEKVAACLCGFWLQDGTYRELVRHIRRANKEIPVILVSDPDCPHEYRDYLAAMNIGAVDFLAHPYRKSDLEGMLGLATSSSSQAAFAGPDLRPRAA
jgi:DNA-binding NtrC family response regulator